MGDEAISNTIPFIGKLLIGLFILLIAAFVVFNFLGKSTGTTKYLMNCVLCSPVFGYESCHNMGICPF